MLYPPDRMTDGACSARCCQPNCSDCSSRNGRESRFETKYKKQKRKKPKYVKININAHVTTKKADKNLVQIIMKNCALTRKLFAKKKKYNKKLEKLVANTSLLPRKRWQNILHYVRESRYTGTGPGTGSSSRFSRRPTKTGCSLGRQSCVGFIGSFAVVWKIFGWKLYKLN